MKPAIAAFAMLGMIPAMTGPLPGSAQAASLTLPLCGGGSLSIPLEGPQQAPGGGSSPCCAKGCHSSSSRKRLDRAQ